MSKKKKQFDYLRPKGTITWAVDRMFDVPEVEINFDGWCKVTVRLWPKNANFSTRRLTGASVDYIFLISQ